MTESTKDAMLRELPVEVTCEIARLTLSAREVLGLVPGTVLPLGRPAGAHVELRSGGRLVARGELCEVEAEGLGVRIREIPVT